MIFPLQKLFEFYYIEHEKIDLCIGFVCGSISSYIFLQFINKSKYPIWITHTHEIYKKSDIIEILYQEYLNTGDKEYELYEESIIFDENKVMIEKNDVKHHFYRTLK